MQRGRSTCRSQVLRNMSDALAAIAVELGIPFFVPSRSPQGFWRRAPAPGTASRWGDQGDRRLRPPPPHECEATSLPSRSVSRERSSLPPGLMDIVRNEGGLESSPPPLTRRSVLMTAIYAASGGGTHRGRGEALAERCRMSGHEQCLHPLKKSGLWKKLFRWHNQGM